MAAIQEAFENGTDRLTYPNIKLDTAPSETTGNAVTPTSGAAHTSLR